MIQESLCNVVQQAIACERNLSETDHQYITACPQCTVVQQHMWMLDGWADASFSDDVPDSFTQGVMYDIENQISKTQSQDLSWIHRVLTQPTKATVLQGAFLVVAVTLGLG